MAPSAKRLARDQTDRKSSNRAALKQAAKRAEALSTKHSLASYLQHFEDCIAPLKAGHGLLGSKEEEEEYEKRPLFNDKPESGKLGEDDDEEGAEETESNSDEEGDKEIDSDDSADNAEDDMTDRPSPGDWVRINEYLGLRHEEHITRLYAVKPMSIPPHMTVTPHEHQLKGASQADFLCRGHFKGLLLGDGMGVGKTLTAILAMWLVKDQPGFSVVVAPKTLCHQWVEQIEGSFEPGHGLTAYYIESAASLTAHELHAMRVDVVVVGYEQLASAARDRQSLRSNLDLYFDDTTGRVTRPKRPNAVLHSSFWRELGLPIKRLVLDEAQAVNKRSGVRHKAIKELYYRGVIALSGTLAHNKWHDVSGYLDFLQGHPFSSHRLFLETFSAYDRHSYPADQADLARMWLLQKLMQGFTIIRPASIIALKSCERQKSSFQLDDATAEAVQDLVEQYKKSLTSFQANSERRNNSAALGKIVMAQTLSLHHLLRDAFQSESEEDGYNEEDMKEMLEGRSRPMTREQRAEWLEAVHNHPHLVEDSQRLSRFLRVYGLIQERFPGKKVVVFSMYLKFLDIVAVALRREYNVEPLRYDGTVPAKARPQVQNDFNNCDSSVPLLLTASAGSYGLNITAANIVIQTEPWWNRSVEEQAIARCWRQGQQESVLALRLFATNSAVDILMSEVNHKKTGTNTELLEPLIRLPEQGPAKVYLRRVYQPVALDFPDEEDILGRAGTDKCPNEADDE